LASTYQYAYAVINYIQTYRSDSTCGTGTFKDWCSSWTTRKLLHESQTTATYIQHGSVCNTEMLQLSVCVGMYHRAKSNST